MIDASAAMARALVASATSAGCAVTVAAVEARDWASATFTGQQHRFRLHVSPGSDEIRWLAGLPEAEWTLPRNLVASVAAKSCCGVITVDILTLHAS